VIPGELGWGVVQLFKLVNDFYVRDYFTRCASHVYFIVWERLKMCTCRDLILGTQDNFAPLFSWYWYYKLYPYHVLISITAKCTLGHAVSFTHISMSLSIYSCHHCHSLVKCFSIIYSFKDNVLKNLWYALELFEHFLFLIDDLKASDFFWPYVLICT